MDYRAVNTSHAKLTGECSFLPVSTWNANMSGFAALRGSPQSRNLRIQAVGQALDSLDCLLSNLPSNNTRRSGSGSSLCSNQS